MTLTIENFISHRFRGFAPQENSLLGCNAALSYGVKYLEFDIRVAACGTPMIYHDEHALGGDGKSYKLSDVKASDYAKLGGDFARFPTFDELLETIAAHPKKEAKLLIDIKDAGFEDAITALVRLHRLHDRAVYVSWVPEALYACHALEPDAPLCLSHWCKKPNAPIRAVHKVFIAKGGAVPRPARSLVHGERSGWYIEGGITGQMLDMLKASSGSVCVPVDMVDKALVDYYHGHGLEVSTFSYVTLESAQKHRDALGIDLFFSDSKGVFAAL